MLYKTFELLFVFVIFSQVTGMIHPLRPFFDFVDTQFINQTIESSGFRETMEDFNEPYKLFTSQFFEKALVRSKNISSTCQRDWEKIVSYAKWEVPKFWDSFAKVGTGIMEGRITYLGQSEECTNVKSGVMPIEFDDFPDTKAFLVAYKPNLLAKFPFTVGVCMPAECSTSDVIEIYKRYENPKKWQPPFVKSAMEQPDIETTSGGFVVAWVAYSTLFLLVAAGTLLGITREALQKYWVNKKLETSLNLATESNNGDVAGPILIRKQNGDMSGKVSDLTDAKPSFWIQFLLCFDFHNNVTKILTIPAKTDSSQLKVLNGIRVMSMAWVVLGHTMLVELSVMDNVVYPVDLSTGLMFQTLTNATPSVDTFFVLSGLLVMLGALRSVERLQKPLDVKFWAMFYIHRIARLWPTMILGILFTFAFIPLMSKFTYSPGYQPYAPGSVIASCQGVNDWASTVFFYNNFVSINSSPPCINWTWYVANDMQFYILSPLVILAVYRWRKVGCGIIASLVFCSSLITLIMTAVKNISPGGGLALLGDPSAQAKYSSDVYWVNTIYFSSYCRFQTYGVGLLLGVALHDLKKIEKLIDNLSVKVRIAVIAFVWILAVFLGIITIYGIYPTVNGHPMDRTATAFYNGTFRLLWGIAVALVILLCCLGYGGVVNAILSSDFWIPFARINYTTYIWHLFWLDIRIMAAEKFFRYSTVQFVLEASGCLALIFCSSVPIAAIVETPFINLEKLLFRRN